MQGIVIGPGLADNRRYCPEPGQMTAVLEITDSRNGTARVYNPSMARYRPICPALASVVIVTITLGFPVSLQADLFELKSGRTIEAEIEKDLGDKLLLRLAIGTLEVDKKDILSQTPGETPWRRYEKEKKKHPDTAAGHYEMAQWCHKQGLRGREIEHLRKTIKHEPNHEAARLALGHVKVKGKWIDPRQRKKEEEKADPQRVEQERQEQVDKLVREIVTKYFVRVKAVYTDRLQGKSPTDAKFIDGRKQLLSIQDPLAIPAISNVLSKGSEPVRRVMIECLSQFLQDEATMNLLVVAVLDGSPEIRRLAAVELIPRKDDRLVDRLRDAVASSDEFTLRNAAAALGTIKAKAAVPDLVNVLSRETKQLVEVTRPVFFRRVTSSFGGGTTVLVDDEQYYYRPDRIGVIDPEVVMSTHTTTEVQIVSIYRTEVQEALISITGVNHGFDGDAWMKWWTKNSK